MTRPIIHDIFESKTGSWQYIVADPKSRSAVIIDPVLDFDLASATVSTSTSDQLLRLVQSHNYKISMILETHAHADHLTAASYLQYRLSQVQDHRPVIGIGKGIQDVQRHFAQQYAVPPEQLDKAFDRFFQDGETFTVGMLQGMAVHLPGHTPDLMGYRFGDDIFCGDSIFNPDVGSARCDFPFGSAQQLFASSQKLLGLPDHSRLWVGHDYPQDGRSEPISSSTVREQMNANKHLKLGNTEGSFVAMRQARDAELTEPRLLQAAIQVNIRGGKLPSAIELRGTPVTLNYDMPGIALRSIRL